MKMLKAKILVKSDPAEEKTKGGIVLPDKSIERPLRGTVVSVGPECSQVREGDVVWHSKHSGRPIKLDDDEFLILTEGEVDLIEISTSDGEVVQIPTPAAVFPDAAKAVRDEVRSIAALLRDKKFVVYNGVVSVQFTASVTQDVVQGVLQCFQRSSWGSVGATADLSRGWVLLLAAHAGAFTARDVTLS